MGADNRPPTTTTASTSKSPPQSKTIKETCPSFRRGHLPKTKDVKRLRELSKPHVGSFDYFLEKGLTAGIHDIVPLEIDLVNPRRAQQTQHTQQQQAIQQLQQPQHEESKQEHDREPTAAQGNVITPDIKEVDTLKIWLENIRITKPVKTDQYNTSMLHSSNSSSSSSSTSGNRLIPRECRELGLMYSGPITGEFCYQINHRKIDDKTGEMTEIEGKVSRMTKRFGDMPIMVMSKACHLYASKPEQLVKMKEEVCRSTLQRICHCHVHTICYFICSS